MLLVSFYAAAEPIKSKEDNQTNAFSKRRCDMSIYDIPSWKTHHAYTLVVSVRVRQFSVN